MINKNLFFFQLHEFLSPLNECRGSSIFKIRELAAKALVSILQKSLDNFEKLASKITPEVCAKITTNQRHGNLLQVSHNNTPSSSLKKKSFYNDQCCQLWLFSTGNILFTRSNCQL